MIPPDQKLGPVDEATPVGHCAVEAASVHRTFDDRGVPRHAEDGRAYSLWGRVKIYAAGAGEWDSRWANPVDDAESPGKARGWHRWFLLLLLWVVSWIWLPILVLLGVI